MWPKEQTPAATSLLEAGESQQLLHPPLVRLSAGPRVAVGRLAVTALAEQQAQQGHEERHSAAFPHLPYTLPIQKAST